MLHGATLVKQDRLEVLEATISVEAFYHNGQKLFAIRCDRLYEKVGFKSWNAYSVSGRIDYRKGRQMITFQRQNLGTCG